MREGKFGRRRVEEGGLLSGILGDIAKGGQWISERQIRYHHYVRDPL